MLRLSPFLVSRGPRSRRFTEAPRLADVAALAVVAPWRRSPASRRLAVLAPLAIVALATGLPSPAAAQSSAEEVEAVKAVVTRLFDGMRTGDADMVRSVFHPEARFVVVTERDGEVLVGFEDPGGFATAVGESREVWDERVTGWQVSVDGRIASVWTDYTFYLGDTFSHCGIDSFEMVKTGEGWLVTQLADTRRTEGCPAP